MSNVPSPPPPNTIPPPPPSDSLETMVEVLSAVESEADERNSDQKDIDGFVLRCMTDFEFFARACLKIKPKRGAVVPLVFNAAQAYLDDVVNMMLGTYGRVRIVIVKGRQQGLSTWVEARGYWKTSQHEGTKAYILTHEEKATKGLFDMAKRFHEHCPAEVKPLVKKSNAKEILFHELESEYAVGTAKVGSSGRGQTLQFFHGSEAAYWASAEEISSGVMEGIPDEPETEVYLESTAAGAGGWFHSMWQNGCFPGDVPPSNWNGYWRVFIPWYWQDEYQVEVPEGFVRTEEEKKYIALYNLEDSQLVWRRQKIAKMKGDVSRFQRDYPFTPVDAFNSSLHNVLIDPNVVMQARKNFREEVYQPMGQIILGVDMAREGDDDTVLLMRQGRVILGHRRLTKYNNVDVAAQIARVIQTRPVYKVLIDVTGGYGGGVYDILGDLGYGDKVIGINFAARANDEDRFKNIRAEMYWGLKDWLEAGAAVPDTDELLVELTAITYKYDSTGERLQLERKSEIKKRLGKSTDVSDAAALTFCVRAPIIGGRFESFDPLNSYGAI